MRTTVALVFIVGLFVGCGGGSGAQEQVDSLRAANQDLQRQVQALRDSVQSGPAETTLTPPIRFPSGSAWLFSDARSQLDAHAEALKQEYPDAEFRIQGYTDAVPIGPSLKDTYPSNWYLAAQRAAAVAHYLDRSHGIRSESIEIEAYGPRTREESTTPEPRPERRKVEIVVEEGS